MSWEKQGGIPHSSVISVEVPGGCAQSACTLAGNPVPPLQPPELRAQPSHPSAGALPDHHTLHREGPEDQVQHRQQKTAEMNHSRGKWYTRALGRR